MSDFWQREALRFGKLMDSMLIDQPLAEFLGQDPLQNLKKYQFPEGFENVEAKNLLAHFQNMDPYQFQSVHAEWVIQKTT